MTSGERLRFLDTLVTEGYLLETLKDLAIACRSKEYLTKNIEDPIIRHRQYDRWTLNRVALETVIDVIQINEDHAERKAP